MGNVIQPIETSSAENNSHNAPLKHNGQIVLAGEVVEDFTSPRSAGTRQNSGEEKRVRFQNVDNDHQPNVVQVKTNENRSSASSSGYESKSCSSIDSDGENAREESNDAISPLYSSAIKEILTCDECGRRFAKSGPYLTHIRSRVHSGCSPPEPSSGNAVTKRSVPVDIKEHPSPKSIAKAHADTIRKTKSYNQERDLLWVAPERLRPKSARPEHRILGPHGNSYLHWLSHLERLDQLSDETEGSEATETPPSTGESTLC